MTYEIHKLGQRTAYLELRVDDLECHAQTYTSELEYLKDENLILHMRLEDHENRAQTSNLHICRISETVLDL